MKKPRILLFLLVSLLLFQSNTGSSSLPELYEKNLMKHLVVLASEDDARVSGFEGERNAAFYIEKTLKEYGYITGRQFFPVTAYSHIFTKLVLCGNDGPREIICEPLIYSGSTRGETIRGKAVIANAGAASDFPEKFSENTIVIVNNHKFSYRKKALNAMKAGASAVIIYEDKDELLRGTVSYPIDIPVLGMGYTEGHKLLNTILDETVYLELTCSTIVRPSLSQNITAFKRHSGQDKPFLIIGAHYDSVNTPGANDNASGAAMLLELSGIFSSCDLGYDLRFVFFGAEELGLDGSRKYAEGLVKKEKCLGMINLDVIAEGNRIRLSTDVKMKNSPLYLLTRQIVSESGISWEYKKNAISDQRSFNNKSIPGIMISAGPLSAYHTDADNIENINMDIMLKTGGIVVDILHAVSDQLYLF